MNYYPHHIGDYLKDTAHLTMIEDGAYRRLIDLYYLHEKPLPAEKRQVYRLARAASTAERGAVDTILDEYFTLSAEGWTHRRCDAEVAKSREKSEKARTSAASRWQSKTHSDGNANASDKDANAYANAQETHGRTHSDGNAYPITNNQEPIQKNPPNPPGGESPAKKPRERKPRIQLKTFIDQCVQAGEKPISGYQPLLTYVENTGLPMDFVQIAWDVFKREFLPPGEHANRLQADWRRHFLNYVEKGYYRLWYAKQTDDGPIYELSTQGIQAQASLRKEAA